MASSAKKLKISIENDSKLQLLYGDDAITKYWSSSLFNTVYLRHDISDRHSCWNSEDDLDFQNFMNTLRNIAAEYKDREKELSSWSETETINNWVKHILHALGWTNNCSGVQNPFLEETSFRYDGKTYRTDILIVDHPKEKQYVNQAKGDDKLKEARQSILMPVEVKYWQRLEEYRQGKNEEKGRIDNESDDIARTTTPNEQTIQYMDILKKNWGILTDGARWRLFNAELSSEDAERYYEFNFSMLFQAMTTEDTEADSSEVIEAAKYFYHFFSKTAFYPKNEAERPFVDDVLQYSKKYVNKVEEDLKERFVKAMNIACNGFYKSMGNRSKVQNLEIIRNVAESALFNILFTKSLESRGILPMASTDYKKISLSSIVDKIERFDPDHDDLLNVRELERAFKKGNGNSFIYSPEGSELHERILRLTSVIHKGTTPKDCFGFEISGFKESVFSKEEWKFFNDFKLSNQDWTEILFELGYAESESMNRKYQQIPYAYFTPRQLGSIYESFLEFELQVAESDMIFEKRQWKETNLKDKKNMAKDLPKVKLGELFFTPNNSEKKLTGSFYTPDFVVQYIVHENLKPIVVDKNAPDILNLKICDVAAGSGHFLVGALRAVTRKYMEQLSEEGKYDSISILEAKRHILSSCIYGVDKNPRAIKLAKLSLWLETATANGKLDDLSDQLKCGDSLVGFEWQREFKPIFSSRQKSGFDLIVGNPPYSRLQSQNTSDEQLISELKDRYISTKDGSFDLYIPFIERALSLLNHTGQLGFIIPNTVLTVRYATAIRQLMANEKCVKSITNFKQFKIFPGVSTYTCILNLTKLPTKKTQYREITNIDVDYDDVAIGGIGSNEYFTDESVLHPENGDAWELKPEKSNILLEKIRSFTKNSNLEDHVEKIFQGFITGRDSTFVLKYIKSDSKFNYGFSEESGEIVKIEKSICKPVFLGKDVHRYNNNDPDNFVIFPYEKLDDAKYELIQSNILEKKYPLAFSYLQSHKGHLEKREKGKFKGKLFYQFSRPQSLKYFDSKKLVMRSFSCQGELFFDKSGKCSFTPNVYGIIPKNIDEDNFYYLMAYLNSNLVWFMIRLTSSGISNGYYQYTTRYTSPLPLVPIESMRKTNLGSLSKIIEYSRKLESATSSQDSDQIADLQLKLDKIFYKIYELSEAEIVQVESLRYLSHDDSVVKKENTRKRVKNKKAA